MHGINREMQDAFAARSHARAGLPRSRVHLKMKLSRPVVRYRRRPEQFNYDEVVLKPPVKPSPRCVRRFPIRQRYGNGGYIFCLSDGAAAAMLVMSESRAHELGLKPRARVHSMAVVGCDP